MTGLHSSLICLALLLVGQMDSFKSCVKEAINKMMTKLAINIWFEHSDKT
jgi:hypothetical protein